MGLLGAREGGGVVSAARHMLDIYGVELHLATTEREWKRLQKRLAYLQDVPDSAGLTHFAVWEPANGSASIPVVSFWIREALTSDPHQLVETCAHEAAHATSHILTWTGHDVRGDDGHDEPSAYLTGWLTRWLWKNTTPALTTEDANE